MPAPHSREPGRRVKRVALLSTALVLMLASLAYAAVGLTNPSFEDGLNGWTAKVISPEGVETGATCADPANQRDVCVTGSDTFNVRSYDETNGEYVYEDVTIAPVDGSKMVRLGGPFHSEDEGQHQDERYQVSQAFTVDPAKPVVALNYNANTFDYTGFDELRFTVRVLNEDGAQIASFVQGAYGPSGDTSYKSTGWQTAFVDLTGFENETVHLAVDSGGTLDDSFGFWSYIDGGEAIENPVDPPTFDLPEEYDFGTYSDPITGQTWITAPRAAIGDTCVPLPLSIHIDKGASTLSNVELIIQDDEGTHVHPMTAGANDTFSYEISCIRDMDLLVRYTLTEGEDSQQFIVPIGGLVLIDPAGVVYDQQVFDQAKAGGASDEEARTAAAVEGASVRLQRQNEDGTWSNVLSGDPGIDPKINPQVTEADGKFAWLTSEGFYRVVVSKEGYPVTVSREVEIPPEVTDLHVALIPGDYVPDQDGDGVPDETDQCDDVAAPGTADGCPSSPPPPPADSDGDGVTDDKDQCPTVAGNLPNGCQNDDAGPKTGPCKGLTGTKLAICLKEQKELKKCNKVKGKKKKSLCKKRARAIAKCEAKQGKKKTKCVKKAKKIGKKGKK